MASVELRRPLWHDLDGALFYDIGTVSEDSWDIDPDIGAGAAALAIASARHETQYTRLFRS